MNLQEISDRMEIQALLVEYCYALDDRDWDAFDRIFTPDAVIDYSEIASFRGNLAETKVFLAQAMEGIAASQHMVSTSQIRIDGDNAWGRTACVYPLLIKKTGKLSTYGLWYRDEYRRTADGWRISKLYEESCWLAV
jgi:hypothetical protein